MFQPHKGKTSDLKKSQAVESASSSGTSMLFSSSGVPLSSAAIRRAVDALEEEKRNSEKLERLKSLAQKGDANAQFHLGLCALKNENVQHEYYRKFLNPELMEADIPLAWFYQKEAGVVENHAEALAWLQKAATQNHIKAQFFVGFCYSEGRGVAKDEQLAFEWYQKAANQGYAPAQSSLGAYYSHKGPNKNDHLAVEWCQKAAVQGDRDAQLNLGAFYINGSGVAINQQIAFDWFQKAAIQGLAMAQFNVGMCFTSGIGIAKDYFQAFEWFQKAAMQGIRPLNIVLATIISTE